MTALVVAADHPLDNIVKVGKRSRGSVRILADGDPAPIDVEGSFKLDKDHWLVLGMEVPIAIDAGKPESFEIDWEAVPSIEERVEANDPTLADPVGAHKRVVEAMQAAGVAGIEAPEPDRLKNALEQAAEEPAPPGRERAVVIIATTTATLVDRGGVQGTGSGSFRDSSGKHDAVLSVNVPGREPYAVLVRGFKRPQDKADVAGAGLPATVSSSDPDDVEVLWDELASVESQVEARISEGIEAAQAGMRAEAEMGQQMMDALKGGGEVPAGANPMAQLAPGMRDMIAANAKQALRMIKDPAQREMLKKQYRAAGIPIDDED